jgi:hypothetical protein
MSPPLGLPTVRLYRRKLARILIKRTISKGVKGMLPLGCLPHWVREGVTLKIPYRY